MLNHSCAVKS